jgi:hypothetical protein
MNLDFDNILKRADELYTLEKLGPDPAPGVTLKIQSDQVKCVLRALTESLQTQPDPLQLFATSVRRMMEFYTTHPSPGVIQPIDAIQIALSDVAEAAENAVGGRQWIGPGHWAEAPATIKP